MFDVVNFIDLVREQRCLWDKSSEVYYNKELRKSAWFSVALNLYDGFSGVSLEVIDERVEEMKKKWRNIQNKFHRYANRAGPASKKKPYVYAENLQFLLSKTSELSPAGRSCKKSRTEGPLDEDNRSPRSVDESPEVEEPTPGPGVSQSLKPYTRIIENKSHSTECQTKQTNNNTSSLEQEQDADKMFLLSLLPDFKSMHEEDKLDYRITTMQFMRYAKRKRRMKTGDTT